LTYGDLAVSFDISRNDTLLREATASDRAVEDLRKRSGLGYGEPVHLSQVSSILDLAGTGVTLSITSAQLAT
jgi:hypothetical protein